MDKSTIQIHQSWLEHLEIEFQKDYMSVLKKKLLDLKNDKIIFYPKGSQIFNAFNLTPFNRVKVVILGQDPYHGPGQAHGLSFSVPPSIKPPPSLINIFKELENDIGKKIDYRNGNLEHWAKQGVLLLNTTLKIGRASCRERV